MIRWRRGEEAALGNPPTSPPPTSRRRRPPPPRHGRRPLNPPCSQNLSKKTRQKKKKKRTQIFATNKRSGLEEQQARERSKHELFLIWFEVGWEEKGLEVQPLYSRVCWIRLTRTASENRGGIEEEEDEDRGVSSLADWPDYCGFSQWSLLIRFVIILLVRSMGL